MNTMEQGSLSGGERDSHCVECERLRKSTKEYKDKINKARREKYKQDKEAGAEAYVKKIEKQKEYNKEYKNRPEVRERSNEWKRQYRRRNGGLSREERKVKYETIKLARHLRDMKVLTVLDLLAIEQQKYDYKKESNFGLALYNRQKSKYRKAMEKGCAHSASQGVT